MFREGDYYHPFLFLKFLDASRITNDSQSVYCTMLPNIAYMSVPQQETFRVSMIAMYFQNRRGACKHYYYVTSSGPKLLSAASSIQPG